MPPSAVKKDDSVVAHPGPSADADAPKTAPPALVTETAAAAATATATATATGPGPDANMTVLGIYKRGKVPREHELPEDYVLKHCARDQIMVRERLNTRPLLDDDDDDDDADTADDELNEQERRDGPSKKTKKKKSPKKRGSLFRKLSKKRKDRDKKEGQEQEQQYDTAMFKPAEGLVQGKEDWPFYHADLDEHSDSSDDERVYDERAILWQSIENYESLMGDPNYSKYFLPPHIVEGGFDAEGKSHVELILDDPRFGEQVIVQGVAASQIAVGDVFEVEGGSKVSPLKVEVSSPRLPCSYVDKKSGSPFGNRGVKRHTMTNGLAGWFTRVLTPGELRDGMRLVRTSHPHPKWTLPETSRALYGEGPKRKMMLGYPAWSRSREELQEFCNLEQLGRVEWKDEAQWILDGNGSSDDEDEDGLKAKGKGGENGKAATTAPVATKKAVGTPTSTEGEGGDGSDLFVWLSGGLAACCTAGALATCLTPVFGQ